MALPDLDKQINSRKPLQDMNKKGWPWLSSWKLLDGSYTMKFLNHSEKCRDGYRVYTVHDFEKEPGDKLKDHKRILCTESTVGLKQVTASQGSRKITLDVLAKPCPVCDMLEQIRVLDDGEWYENELETDVRDVLHKMSSAYVRTVLFPVLIYCNEVKNRDSGYTDFVPHKTNLGGFILQLRVNKDERDKLLYKEICKLEKSGGFYDPSGPWVKLTKERRDLGLSLLKSRELTAAEERVYKGYPSITEYGKGVESGSFKREASEMSYDRGVALMKNTWWAKAMQSLDNPFHFDNLERGIATRIPKDLDLSGAEDEDEDDDAGEMDSVEDDEMPF